MLIKVLLLCWVLTAYCWTQLLHFDFVSKSYARKILDTFKLIGNFQRAASSYTRPSNLTVANCHDECATEAIGNVSFLQRGGGGWERTPDSNSASPITPNSKFAPCFWRTEIISMYHRNRRPRPWNRQITWRSRGRQYMLILPLDCPWPVTLWTRMEWRWSGSRIFDTFLLCVAVQLLCSTISVQFLSNKFQKRSKIL